MQEGGEPIYIESINSDVENIWFNQIPLDNNLAESEKARILKPLDNKVSEIQIKIRSWERVFFHFGEETPELPIRLSVEGKTEEYYPSPNEFDHSIVTSVSLNSFWLIQLLSNILVFTTIFILIYALLFCSNLFIRINISSTQFKRIFLFFMILLIILGFININPQITHLSRDSGVYLYIGKALLSGKIPYKDVWDHKGPSIYLINALGLATGLGRWGVWFIEIIFSVLSLILVYALIKKTTHTAGAVIGSLIFYGLIFKFIGSGNYVEEYAIPLYFLAFLLFLNSREGSPKQNRHRYFAIGLLSGFTFLLRPNLISPFLAIGLVLLFEGFIKKTYSVSVHALFAVFLGFAAVILVTSFYFIINDAFQEFYFAVFRHNFGYANYKDFYTVFIRAFKIFSDFPKLMILPVAGSVLLILNGIKNNNTNKYSSLRIVILIGSLFELLFYNLSGRDYQHYYLSLIPYICLVTSLGFTSLFQFRIFKPFLEDKQIFFTSFLLLIMIFPSVILETIDNFNEVRVQKEGQNILLSELKATIPESEYVLFWGAETAYNYLLDKQSPTRYVYQFPLTWCSLIVEQDIDQFIQDLEKTKAIIIDASNTNVEIHSLDYAEHQGGCPQLKPLFEYVEEQYIQTSVLSNNWIIYQPIQ
ncbi:MAG: glycosyltransferase family 39 protein [Anaerolineaceae bacterium]|nr:glycosyltransferase family 39 protein [Anaerolineaceae bacterium]